MFNKTIFAFLIFIVFAVSCDKQSPKVEKIIAEWQEVQIDSAVFVSEYVRYVSTFSVQDSPESRQQFAQQLLERKIVANEAKKIKMDTVQSVKNKILRAQELALAKYFIRDKVQPTVKTPTETELKGIFKKSNSKLLLFQIYAPDEATMNTYYEILTADTSKFAEIAQQSMIEAGEKPNTYNMGWVSWNKMDLNPESVAFDLEINEISKPVKSLVGWHIFKLVNKEETFFADNSTYQNAKEGLAQVYERRQFEENSTNYINSTLQQTELALYPKNIQLVWDYLAPRIPNNKQEIVRFLNQESDIWDDQSPPEDLALATLDGDIFTFKDFKQRLPNIPYWQLQPNLRPAIETVLKDKLFTNKALAENFLEHQKVQTEIEIAETSALHTQFINSVSDTLQVEPLAENWYQSKKTKYIDKVEVVFRAYIFTNELTARNAVSDFEKNKDWDAVLQNYESGITSRIDTFNSIENANHPILSLQNVETNPTKKMLWGPYNLNGNWNLVEVLEINRSYPSFTDSKSSVIAEMKQQILTVSHLHLLQNAGFEPSDIVFNDELLTSVLPFYF